MCSSGDYNLGYPSVLLSSSEFSIIVVLFTVASLSFRGSLLRVFVSSRDEFFGTSLGESSALTRSASAFFATHGLSTLPWPDTIDTYATSTYVPMSITSVSFSYSPPYTTYSEASSVLVLSFGSEVDFSTIFFPVPKTSRVILASPTDATGQDSSKRERREVFEPTFNPVPLAPVGDLGA